MGEPGYKPYEGYDPRTGDYCVGGHNGARSVKTCMQRRRFLYVADRATRHRWLDESRAWVKRELT